MDEVFAVVLVLEVVLAVVFVLTACPIGAVPPTASAVEEVLVEDVLLVDLAVVFAAEVFAEVLRLLLVVVQEVVLDLLVVFVVTATKPAGLTAPAVVELPKTGNGEEMTETVDVCAADALE